MSAQQSSPAAWPPGGNADSDDPAAGGSAEGGHPLSQAAAAPEHPNATAELANLLAHGQWGSTNNLPTGFSEAHGSDGGYDGHVALALDTGALPDLDSTLDLLTSSHHLFDVPALDVSSGSDDASST